MTKVLRVDTHGKVQDVGRGGLGHLQGGETTLDVRVAVIQALIPLGLQAVEEQPKFRTASSRKRSLWF